MKTKVYIASPYSTGDQGINVKRQMDMAATLMNLGFAPYAPIANTHFQHIVHPRSYEFWIELDKEWVAGCDVLLRLDGPSKGADVEEAFARSLHIPVVYSVQELLAWDDDRAKAIKRPQEAQQSVPHTLP